MEHLFSTEMINLVLLENRARCRDSRRCQVQGQILAFRVLPSFTEFLDCRRCFAIPTAIPLPENSVKPGKDIYNPMKPLEIR